MLEKTPESPLDCREIQPIHPKGDQSWVFFGRTDAKAETPVLWPPHAKSWLNGKDSDAGRDWGQEEKGTTEDEMAGWHHRLYGHEFEWTPGVGDGQGGPACCGSRGRKGLDTTERLHGTELEWNMKADLEGQKKVSGFTGTVTRESRKHEREGSSQDTRKPLQRWLCRVELWGFLCLCPICTWYMCQNFVKLSTLNSSQVVPVVKNTRANAGDIGDASRIPGLGRSLGERVFSCLENPMDIAAWWATVRRVAESQTRLRHAHTRMVYCVSIAPQ